MYLTFKDFLSQKLKILGNKTTLYDQVRSYLLDKIKKDFRPGDLLPTQLEIAKETNTSLITVKRAIKELEAAGYLEAKAGKGTIVKQPQVLDNHIGVSSWTDSIASQGNIPSTAWTTIKKGVPSKSVTNLLQLKSRERTVRVERLRLIDEQPICLMTNEIPLQFVPEMDSHTQIEESLYTYLRKEYNLVPASAEEEVCARPASEEEIKLLELRTPIVLVIKRLSFLFEKTPFEFSSIVAAADSYVYRSQQINKTLDAEVLKKLLTTS